MSSTTKTASSRPEQIDLSGLFTRAVYALQHVGWVVILLVVICAAAYWLRVTTTYTNSYTAEATLTVSATKNSASEGASSFANVETAEQMGKVFPYIMSSGILTDIIADDLGTEGIQGSINVEVVENTNLVTIKVTSDDGQMAYDILQSVIRNYPEVALYVIGQVNIDVLNETGVPEATSSTTVFRGSLWKGAAIGLVLGLLIVFLYAVLHRTILYPSDFNSLLHVPCLGTLPLFRKKRRRRKLNNRAIMLGKNISQEYLESMRTVRTRVERRMEKLGAKTLMVTSSVPSEGKSTVATNLAISFAQKGKRVVIVDCDLRNPSVQKSLNLPGEYPGLAAVLRGEAKLEDALCPVEQEGMQLEVLCGAVNVSQSISILGGEAMNQLIAQLEERADLVILDISPSAMLADAIVMARNVPCALYVVKYDHASTRRVVEGVSELAETGIEILGCVLNQGKFNSTQAGSYSYRYGSYGSGYRTK